MSDIKYKETENTLGFLHIKACGATDIGKRKDNQDTFLINEKLGLYIVADGMGGLDMGKIASLFASSHVEGIVATLETAVASRSSDETLDDVVIGANKDIYEAYLNFAINLTDKELRQKFEKDPDQKVGTTLVSFFVRGKKIYIANVGDSRAYKISAGAVSQITHDHSLVASEVRAGNIDPEDARTTKGKNIITRFVGVKESELADIYSMTVYPNERFLLCTDGLSNTIDERTLLRYACHKNIRIGCEQLVTLARDNGGKDNITAILIEIVGVDEKAKSPEPANDEHEETIV